MALTAFLYAKKAVGNAQALDPAAFCVPKLVWSGMYDRKPSLTAAKEHRLDNPRSRRLIDKGAAQITAKPARIAKLSGRVPGGAAG
jgi:hypothetical protein